MSSELLVSIAGCSIARRHIEDCSFSSPCREIVCSQGVQNWDEFQVPEPWSGFIVSAPILYLSSNPSISEKESYPLGSAGPHELIDFFQGRFEGKWVRGGSKPRQDDGTYGASVKYWSGIRNRTSELLGRPSIPGRDYALTEIVHCKSRGEAGVGSAMELCARRYLEQTLRSAGAQLIVIVGQKTRRHFNSLRIVEVPTTGGTEMDLFGIHRIVVYLGHPTGPEPKKFEAYLSAERIDLIRSLHKN